MSALRILWCVFCAAAGIAGLFAALIGLGNSGLEVWQMITVVGLGLGLAVFGFRSAFARRLPRNERGLERKGT